MRYKKYGTDRTYTVDEAIKREINSKDFNPSKVAIILSADGTQ